MANPRITAASKINIARAALGVTILASAFAAQATSGAEAASARQPAPVADQIGKTGDEAKINITPQQVLALARSQVGTSENASGGGTPYQRWYANSQRAAETIARDGGSRAEYLNAPWCAMFVSWVGEKAGARQTIGWDAWTVGLARWFRAKDRFGDRPEPGAVVFFNWNGSKDISAIRHVGFVVKDNQDGTISTIEGNTGNGRVEERVRPKSQVVGYGYPDYAS
jgi:hypothetical protein